MFRKHGNKTLRLGFSQESVATNKVNKCIHSDHLHVCSFMAGSIPSLQLVRPSAGTKRL